MPPRPASSLRLRALLESAAARRPNPTEEGPLSLWTQAPEPEQPWIHRGDFSELGWATDEAVGLGRAPGTVVRVESGGRERYLGLIDERGELVRAPGLPRGRPKGARTWVEAWEGPRAMGPWMLAQGEGVPLGRLVLATCACARTVLWAIPPREGRPLAGLEAAEAWAEGSLDAVGFLGPAASAERCGDEATQRARRVRAQLPDPQRFRFAYAARAIDMAANGVTAGPLLEAPRPEGPASAAAATAGSNAAAAAAAVPSQDRTIASERERAMAPLVRRFLGLGTVLLAARRREEALRLRSPSR